MGESRVSLRALWLLFLASFGLFGFTAHGYTENGDAQITMVAARAWLLRGDPGLVAAGDTQLLAEGQEIWRTERIIAGAITDADNPRFGRTGVNGKQYIWFPIGHQLLLVPFVWMGELLAGWFPGPEADLIALRDSEWGDFFWAQFFCSLVPSLAAAGALVLLFLLARAMACTPAEAISLSLVATLCTQFWPGSSETTSDMPGLFFLLAAFYGVLRYHQGCWQGPGLFLAGLCAGAAVSLRYPHALPVAVLCLWAGISAFRSQRRRQLGALILGGLPSLVFLATANYLRFGSLSETGYSGATGLLTKPPLIGLYLVLLSWGKGVLWFSPPLMLALAMLRRRCLTAPVVAALLILVLPAVLIGSLHYWAAGMCWGIRYLTPSVVIVVAVLFAQERPWRRRPGWFITVAVLGFLVNLGGVLTPYRGQQELANHAVQAAYEKAGVDVVNTRWAFSPLHSHWTYAYLSLSGRIGSGRSEDSTEPLFGQEIPSGRPPPRLTFREDSGFRHLLPFYMEDRVAGFPLWLVLVLWGLGTGLCGRAALRRLL